MSDEIYFRKVVYLAFGILSFAALSAILLAVVLLI